MKQNQFKIAIGVGVAFLAIITIMALWAGASSRPNAVTQQASTRMGFFNGHRNNNSNSNRNNKRENHKENHNKNEENSKPILFWQKGLTIKDSSSLKDRAYAMAGCPEDYSVINCSTRYQCEEEDSCQERKPDFLLSDYSIITDARKNKANYAVILEKDYNICATVLYKSEHPTNAKYTTYALCLRKDLQIPEKNKRPFGHNR